MNREQHINYTKNELTNHEYYKNIISILKEENILSIVDVGANVGEYTNVFFNKIPTLKEAFLIEPDIDNFNFMIKNVKYENIKFFNFGIGYNLKNPYLVKDPNNVGGFKIVENNGDVKSNFKIKTLEELDLPIVDLIKLDIEGGEYNVIEHSTYLKKIKWVEIEFHNYWNVETENYVKIHFKDYEIYQKDVNNLGIARVLLKRNG